MNHKDEENIMAFNKGLTIVDANPLGRSSISLDNFSHGLFQSSKTTSTADSANGSVVFTIRPGARGDATDDASAYQEIIEGQNIVIGIQYNTTPAATAGTEFRLVVQNRVDYDAGNGTTDAVYSDYIAVNTETTFGLTFQQNGTLTLMQSGGIIKTLDLTSWTPKVVSVELTESALAAAALQQGHIILDDLKGNLVEVKGARLEPGVAADGALTALKTAFDLINHSTDPSLTSADKTHGFTMAAVAANKLAISRTDGADFKIMSGPDGTQGAFINATAATKKIPTAFIKFSAAMNGKRIDLDFDPAGAAESASLTLAAASTTAALAAAEYAVEINTLANFTAKISASDDSVVEVVNDAKGFFDVEVVEGNSTHVASTLFIADSMPKTFTRALNDVATNDFNVTDITANGLNTASIEQAFTVATYVNSDLLDKDYDGFISQVAEFNGVLTSTELSSYVNSPATIPTPELNADINLSSAVISLTGDKAVNGKVYEVELNRGEPNEFKFKFTAADALETSVMTGLKAAFDVEAATTAGNRGFGIDATVGGQLKVTRADGADFAVGSGAASTYVVTGDIGHLTVNGEALSPAPNAGAGLGGKNTSTQIYAKFVDENTKHFRFELLSESNTTATAGDTVEIALTSANGGNAALVDNLIGDLTGTGYTGTRVGTQILKIERADGRAFSIDPVNTSTTGVGSSDYGSNKVKTSVDGVTFATMANNAAVVNAAAVTNNNSVHSSETEAAQGVLSLKSTDLANIIGKNHEFVLDSGAGQVVTVPVFIPLSTANINVAMATINTKLATAEFDAGTDGDLDVDANGDGNNTTAASTTVVGDETGFDYNLQSVGFVKFGAGTNTHIYNFDLGHAGIDAEIEHTAITGNLLGSDIVSGLIDSGIAATAQGFTLSQVGDDILKIVREDGAKFTISPKDHGTDSTYTDGVVTFSEDNVTAYANLLKAATAANTTGVSGSQIVFDRDDGQNFSIKLGANDEAGLLRFNTEGGANTNAVLTKSEKVTTTNGADKSIAGSVSNKVIQNLDFTTLKDATVVTSGGVTNYAAKASTDILGLSKRNGTELVKLGTTTVGMADVDSVGYTGAAAAASGGSAANVLYGQLRDVGKEAANREMLVDIFIDPAKITDGNFQSLSYTVDFANQSFDLQEYTQLKPVGGYQLTDTTSAVDKVTAAWFQPNKVTDFSKAIATMKLKNTSPGTSNPLLTFTKVDIDGVDFNDNSTYATSFTDTMNAKLVDVADRLLNGINDNPAVTNSGKRMANELVAVEASTGNALSPTPSSGLYMTLNDWSTTASAASPNVQYDLNLKTATSTQVIKFKIDLPATATNSSFALDAAVAGDAANGVAATWTLSKNAIEGRALVVEGTGNVALAAGASLGKITSTVTGGHAKTHLFDIETVQTDTDTAFETGRDLYVATATTAADGTWQVNDLPVGIMSRYYEGAAAKAQSSISAMDALHALQISAGAVPSWAGYAAPTNGQIIAADFDGSGKVTAADALALLQASVNPNADARMDWFFFDKLTTGVLVNDVDKNIKALSQNTAISTDKLFTTAASLGLDQGDRVVLIGDLTDPGV
jgi:hypothetical protein